MSMISLSPLFCIVKLLYHAGANRKSRIRKMERALGEYIVEGVKTTIPFHQKLMANERFRAGDFTTKFLEEWDYKA